MADLGLKGHGSELDVDADAEKPGFSKDQVIVQLRKLADYPDGGVVYTDDGEEIKVSNREARMLAQVQPSKLGPLFGLKSMMARDPDMDAKVLAKLQTSDGLNKVLGLIRK